MQELRLQKPDGRELALYGSREVAVAADALALTLDSAPANPHLRWHPLRGEWVCYATHRQERTFLPPPDFDPLRPASDPAFPTELPPGAYEVAVFENRFPALSAAAHDPPRLEVETAPARGRCEVVVFSQQAEGSLGSLPLPRIELILEVLGRRTQLITELGGIQYVMPFENRGAEVGVTLHHPHGQIYAYPFVPPVPARMHAREREHHARHGRALLEALIDEEMTRGERALYTGEHAVAFVPAWARYPYEVWVAPRRAAPDLAALDGAQRADLARALKLTLLRYDALWNRPFPYIMVWYQAPFDGGPRAGCHVHAELYPPYRMPDRLKYLAGTEIGAGLFANDTDPADKARELRATQVSL